MELRLAVIQDLPQIKNMYKDIIKQMDENHIQIWDDIYPCEFFEDDIKNSRLYFMSENNVIVSAFALCSSNSGESSVEWENNCGKSLYLDRLGVNTDYWGKGIGSLTLTKAKETAKALGADYLRLFVVDINIPAIRLYTKNSFILANGIYDEVIDTDYILHEYGYEIKL